MLDFENVGKSLKNVAKTFFAITLIFSIVISILLMATGETTLIVSGAIILIVGILLSWIGCILIYAIGETHEVIMEIKNKNLVKSNDLEEINKESKLDEKMVKNDSNTLEKYKEMLKSGEISQAEYNAKMRELWKKYQ